VGRYAIEGGKFWGVERGFEDLLTDPNVNASPVKTVAMVAQRMAGTTQGFLPNPAGRKQLLFADRIEHSPVHNLLNKHSML
jgi:hypothetical protein